ncbi:MAG: DUF445 family protein [Desulfobulbaceae bacterium]
MIDTTLLAWAGPPLVGAFIGYLTNRIAIRMLFRPLRKWRLLGIPIPMTPGVIPAKRHELAVNIGEMVGTHLLTSRDIGAALSEERFQEHLVSRIEKTLDELFSRDFGPVPTLVPERFQSYFKVGVRTVRFRLRSAIHSYLESDEFAAALERTLHEQMEEVGGRPLNSIVSAEERKAVYAFLEHFMTDLLAGEETEAWLARFLRDHFRRALEEGKRPVDYIPSQLHGFIGESITRHAPAMIRQLARLLAEPPVRERIIRAVRGGVDDFISSLGPIGALAGSFLDMNALEDRVRDYLVSREDEIRAWLENPQVQERFAEVLREQVEKLLARPLADLAGDLDGERLAGICGETARQILGLIRSPGVVETMTAMLGENLEHIFQGGERSSGEVADRILGPETVAGLQKTVVGETVALARSKKTKNLVDRAVNELFDTMLARPVGVLADLLPPGVRRGIADYAVLLVNRVMVREVPGLVDSLEISRIVTEKVDSLDLLRLERLLLSIMEEQFKYINLFGALLGFVIGLANLLLLHLP